jgi:holo-[acyl-carrier protein] synthase
VTALLETPDWSGSLDDLSVRVGCDVVALAEVERSLDRFGDRYLRRVFAASEIRDCVGVTRIERLAARFAAKEAVIKAFAAPDVAIALSDIAVISTAAAPTLRLTGDVARCAREHGWMQTSLSLSHTDCHAMATVAVLCRSHDAEEAVSSPGF